MSDKEGKIKERQLRENKKHAFRQFVTYFFQIKNFTSHKTPHKLLYIKQLDKN